MYSISKLYNNRCYVIGIRKYDFDFKYLNTIIINMV